MRPFLRRFALVLLLAATTLWWSAALPAQARDKDREELQHYTLSMDRITRLGKVLEDAAAAAKADPSLARSLEGSERGDDDSLDRMTHRIESSPALVAILTRNGFTAHEFVVLTMVTLQAGMAEAMMPKGETVESYAAKIHANPANLIFVREHKKELQALQERATQATGGASAGDH